MNAENMLSDGFRWRWLCSCRANFFFFFLMIWSNSLQCNSSFKIRRLWQTHSSKQNSTLCTNHKTYPIASTSSHKTSHHRKTSQQRARLITANHKITVTCPSLSTSHVLLGGAETGEEPVVIFAQSGCVYN